MKPSFEHLLVFVSWCLVISPNPVNSSLFARLLVSQNTWSVLSVLSSDLKGAPFGNVVSFSDGLLNKGQGVPYFYLTVLDPTFKVIDQKSKEAELARTYLFAKYPEMQGWPKDHNFQVFKLEIEDIFLINMFGGRKPLIVAQYLNGKI